MLSDPISTAARGSTGRELFLCVWPLEPKINQIRGEEEHRKMFSPHEQKAKSS